MGIRTEKYYAKEPDPYVNRDPRCTHPPIEYDAIDYCWGYATAVDAGTEAEFVDSHCPGCDMWKVVE